MYTFLKVVTRIGSTPSTLGIPTKNCLILLSDKNIDTHWDISFAMKAPMWLESMAPKKNEKTEVVSFNQTVYPFNKSMPKSSKAQPVEAP